jgi:hypothetical protein
MADVKTAGVSTDTIRISTILSVGISMMQLNINIREDEGGQFIVAQ